MVVLMANEKDLYPTPLGVQLFITAIKKPVVASAVVGFPFGAISYALALFDTHPFQLLIIDAPGFASGIHGVMAWFSVALVCYLRLTRPY